MPRNNRDSQADGADPDTTAATDGTDESDDPEGDATDASEAATGPYPSSDTGDRGYEYDYDIEPGQRLVIEYQNSPETKYDRRILLAGIAASFVFGLAVALFLILTGQIQIT